MILTDNAEIDFFKWVLEIFDLSKDEYNEYYSRHSQHMFIAPWFFSVGIEIMVTKRNGYFFFRINKALYVKSSFNSNDEAFEAGVIWANNSYNKRFKEVKDEN